MNSFYKNHNAQWVKRAKKQEQNKPTFFQNQKAKK